MPHGGGSGGSETMTNPMSRQDSDDASVFTMSMGSLFQDGSQTPALANRTARGSACSLAPSPVVSKASGDIAGGDEEDTRIGDSRSGSGSGSESESGIETIRPTQRTHLLRSSRGHAERPRSALAWGPNAETRPAHTTSGLIVVAPCAPSRARSTCGVESRPPPPPPPHLRSNAISKSKSQSLSQPPPQQSPLRGPTKAAARPLVVPPLPLAAAAAARPCESEPDREPEPKAKEHARHYLSTSVLQGMRNINESSGRRPGSAAAHLFGNGGATGAVEKIFADQRLMSARCEDRSLPRHRRVLWQVFYWCKHMTASILMLLLLCMGLLMVVFIAKYAPPPEYWWVRTIVDVLMSFVVSSWPVCAISCLLKSEYVEKLQWYVVLPTSGLLAVIIIVLHTYVEREWISYTVHARQAILVMYIVNVSLCAYFVRNAKVKRLGRYILFAFGVPVLVLPLYTFVAAPLIWHGGAPSLVVFIFFRFVFHPIITEGIATVARTLAIVSEDAVNKHMMGGMLCVSRIVSAFYGRVLLTGLTSQVRLWHALIVMGILELMGFAFIRERHKFTRAMFRCILGVMRRGKRKTKSSARVSAVPLGEDPTPPDTAPLVRRSNTDEELGIIADDDEDSGGLISGSADPVGMTRTLSLTDIPGNVTVTEEERFFLIVADDAFMSMLYENVSIVLIPLVFLFYWDVNPSHTVTQEAMWHALRTIVLQLSVEIVVDCLGVLVLEWRGIHIFKTAARHNSAMFDTESVHYFSGFMLLLLTLPIYSMWPAYQNFVQATAK